MFVHWFILINSDVLFYNSNTLFYTHTHSCDLSPAPPALLAGLFPAGILFSTVNAKETTLNKPCHAIPINKYMPNKNNKYINQNTNYAISTRKVSQTKHKYSISIKRIR